MGYEAIIFDLDGTAMPSARDALPNEVMCSTVQKYRTILKLCAATGRPWPLAKPIIQALGVSAPSIIGGGALIIDPVREEILWQVTIDRQTARQVIAAAQQHPYLVAFATDLTVTDPKLPKDIDIADDLNTLYIADIATNDMAEFLATELRQIVGITVTKAHSWNIPGGIDLHITNSQSTKEHAVIELCNMLGVNPANVAGVGDGHNDIHLFNSVGHKIAMGNAVDELKAAANQVIASLDEDGLAKFIESSV
jgi:Cof subfamily protein (haloacid dehalogenase superfamily)